MATTKPIELDDIENTSSEALLQRYHDIWDGYMSTGKIESLIEFEEIVVELTKREL
jgi:hypothetical protein